MSANTENANGVKAMMVRTRKSFSKATDAAMAKVAEIKNTKKHAFTFSADPSAQVCVAGTFSNWEPLPMKFSEKKNAFTYKASLKAGTTVEYKYVVNGEWVCDSNAETTCNNGNVNNLIAL